MTNMKRPLSMDEALANLTTAQANLAEAQKEHAAAQRREDELMLQRTVKTGRELKDEYSGYEQQFRRLQGVVQQLQNRLYECNAAMAQHIGAKPDLLDFPSNDGPRSRWRPVLEMVLRDTAGC